MNWEQNREQRWRIPVVILTGVLGAVLSVIVHHRVEAAQLSRISAQAEASAGDRVNAILRSFDADIAVLHAIRAFYVGSNEVEAHEFRLFTADALERRGSLMALEWARRVPAESRESYEKAVPQRVQEEFRIWEQTPDRRAVRAADGRAEYFPVEYVEPAEENRGVAGLDLAFEEERRRTLNAARDSLEVCASTGIQTVQGGSEGALAMLFAVAIYENNLDARTAEERNDTGTLEGRQRSHSGYAVALVDVDAVIAEALAPYGSVKDVHLWLVDAESEMLLHGTGEQEAWGEPLREQVGGRTLEFHYAPTPQFLSARRTAAPLALGLGVALLTLAAMGYLALVARRTARVEALVADRTAEIRRVSRLQQAILDSASYSIISTDPQGIILTFNAAAERMLGYRAEDLVGKQTPAIWHRPAEVEARAVQLTQRFGRPVPAGFPALVGLAEQDQPDTNEWTFLRADGSAFPVSLSITALHDEQGVLTGFLGIAYDITDAKRAEREIQEAVRVAEAANLAKSRFLANMSHELRTPLNAIIGYSEILAEDAGEADASQEVADLQRIRTAGHHLLRLINDVLDLSKVEAGRVTLHIEPVDIEPLVQEMAATVGPLIARNRNRMEISVAGDAGTFHTDATRLRQVLVNLLSNAAKFTEDGTVRIEARREGGDLVFRVEDTGIGMTAEQLERVFEPFAQADESTTRRFGGTGLGLAICRQFCELLGGRIDAASEPGRGSAFTVRLRGGPSPPAGVRVD